MGAKAARRATAVTAMALCLIMLAGCARSRGDVRLATDRKMLARCAGAYGECEILGKTEYDGETKYAMRDVGKDFPYTARTYARAIWLDTVLGYAEDWDSDFGPRYLEEFREEYMAELADIEGRYGAAIDFDAYSWLAAISGADAAGAAEELDALLAGWDGRGYWGEFELRLQGPDGTDAGTWRHGTGLLSPDDTLAEWFMTVAASEIGCRTDDLGFLRIERGVPCAELDGYDEVRDSLVHILGSDNHTKDAADMAVFVYRGAEYWIADLCWQDGYGRMRHLGNFPSRYGNGGMDR